MGSQSVRIGFLFSHSYIAACINIRLGLKWKWSANFSIQAREDKRQIKQKRNHLTSQRNKNTFKMNNLHCRSSCCFSMLRASPSGKPLVRTSLLHLAALVLGRGEWGGPGWAAAGGGQCAPLEGCMAKVWQPAERTQPMNKWGHCKSFTRASSPCKWCGSQNSQACQELTKMRKKQLVMKEVQGRCWLSLAGSAVSLQRAWLQICQWMPQAVQFQQKPSKKGCETVFRALVGLQRTQYKVPAWDALPPC